MTSQSIQTRKRDKFKSLFQRTTSQPPESSNSVAAATSPRKRDKLKFIFHPATPQPSPPLTSIPQLSSDNLVPTAPNILDTSPPPPTPIPSQQSTSDNEASTAPNALDMPPPRVVSQKTFVKSKMFEKDIAVLSIAYIIAEIPELRRLIHLIVEIHDKDEDDQLIDILETCARFSVQLASAAEAHPAEATEAIAEFIKTIETINIEDDVPSMDALTCMVDDEIAKVKSSHPQLALNRDSGLSDRLSKVVTAAIAGSITILSIAKDAGNVIPVPWVQGVIGGVVNLLNAVAQTRSNYDEMRQIAATAGEFVISCAMICSDSTTELPKLKRALNKFTKTLGGIAKSCEELSGLNPFWRYLQNNEQKNTLQGIRTRLNIAIELFQAETQIHMQLDIKDINRKLDYAALNDLPKHPHYDLAEYLGGSRDDVLGYVSGWIDQPAQTILWIHGAAGLGKSIVGQQLVRLLKEDERLAGSVFLTSLTKEPPATIIQTIARQLGGMHPRAIADIAEAARKHDDPHSALRDYFKAYIIDPIRRLEYPYQLVVVIDGLDEWTSYESFLAELAHIPSPSPVKFILTSRPSHSIQRILNELAVQPYSLPLVSQEIIERYFNHHFKTINWRARQPDQFIIKRLASHAQGLLIWAATVRSLLLHEFDERYPHEILEQILLSKVQVGTRSDEQLALLYRDAISTLFPKLDIQEKLRDFVGAMMVLQEPISRPDFAHLIGMSERPAEEIQRRLAVFQTRGKIQSDIIPPAIHQFHFSFLEFMQSTSTEYDGQSIAVTLESAHLMVAKRCLEVVFSELLQSYRGKTCAYSELRGVEPYAIKYWPMHLSNGTSRLSSAPAITGTLTDVSEEYMQRWAVLLLPCIATRFQDGDGYGSLDNIPRSALPYKLAKIIGTDDFTTLSHQLYCLEIAVRLQPNDVETWTALGKAYDRLYRDGWDSKSLDEEIDVLRHALKLVSRKSAAEGSLGTVDVDVPRDSGRRMSASGTDVEGGILTWLAIALWTRFKRQGTSKDLDDAISMHQEALALRPAPHPDRAESLNNVATALQTRFNRQGTSKDLNDVISMHREALSLRLAPHPDRGLSLNNLANALRTRFNRQGTSKDLDDAISMHQEALALRPVPHPDRAESLNNLANALWTRFRRQGASKDLDDVISMHQEALALRPAPHPDRSSSLNNLANALRTRYNRQGTSKDLDDVISMHQEALALRPAPHPDRASSLNNLANALRTRFKQQSTPKDLDDAILMHREALALRPAPHPRRSSSLYNLAGALQTRFEWQGAVADRTEAEALRQEAQNLKLVLWPSPHPEHSMA